jgi:hypothetical protein
MDSTNSQVQIPTDSENFQHNQPHSGQAESSTVSNENVQYNIDHNAQSSVVVDTLVQNTSITNSQDQNQNHVHPSDFFYRPSNGFYHYHVSCREIPYNTITYLLNKSLNSKLHFNENEYIFFYQQLHDNRFYQVTCEIVSPSLVTNYLNENFHRFELQHMEQENLIFTSYQKENLEYYLTRYLSQYLLD